MATSNVKLALLIDKRSNKVVFAEAGKDFVDILFRLLSLPIGTVINILKEENMVGCIRNLYKSIETLDDEYLQPHLEKDQLLNSHVASSVLDAPFPPPRNIFLYTCRYNNDHKYVSCLLYSSTCHVCLSTYKNRSATMSIEDVPDMKPLDISEGGCVKKPAIYMVTDDLLVKPMSMIHGVIELLEEKASGIDFASNFERRDVEFGADEGLKLLKASLESNAALSIVFLGKEELNNDVDVVATPIC